MKSHFIQLIFILNKTVNAIAIRARLLHPCENPLAETPAIGPAKTETTANIKPNAERQINIIIRFRIAPLLIFLVNG